MANEAFELYYQPIVALGQAGSAVPHVELLIRLQEDDAKLAFPGDFIPAAERYQQMPAIDRWVFSKACDLLDAASANAFININVSVQSLVDENFLAFIMAKLRNSRLPPHCFCLEVTETAVIENLATARHFMEAVTALGCRVALDDFGSGLASFSYLKSLPVNYLKIDSTFIKSLLTDPIDPAVVEAVCSVGRVAGIQTIAEGVESYEVIERLQVLGVDYVQGYALAHPKSVSVFSDLLAAS